MKFCKHLRPRKIMNFVYDRLLSRPVNCLKLRLVHGSIGVGSHLMIAVLLTVTDSQLKVNHPTTSPVLAVLVMAELVRFVLNKRWLHMPAELKPISVPGQNTSTQKPPAQPSTCKTIVYSTVLLSVGTLLAFCCCLLFGAPLSEKYTGTLALTLVVITSTQLPLVLYLGPHASIQHMFNDNFELARPHQTAYLHMVQRNALGALLGTWCSSVCTVLDWDQQWQAYPIPNIYGALFGLLLANMCTVIIAMTQLVYETLQALGVIEPEPPRVRASNDAAPPKVE